jgi:hypothetical protein
VQSYRLVLGRPDNHVVDLTPTGAAYRFRGIAGTLILPPRRRRDLSPCRVSARAAEHSVLYRVIDEHLETFLDAAAQHADGHRLPKFVEQEFRDSSRAACWRTALRGSAVATAPSSGWSRSRARGAGSARAAAAGA